MYSSDMNVSICCTEPDYSYELICMCIPSEGQSKDGKKKRYEARQHPRLYTKCNHTHTHPSMYTETHTHTHSHALHPQSHRNY